MSAEFEAELLAMLGSMYKYAYALSRSRDIAEDLVQATCEKALANRESFDPDTRFQAWLFKILRNTFIDMTRRQKAAGSPVALDDVSASLALGNSGAAETATTLRQVLRAIEQLAPEQREVMVLVCIEELTYREAATILDVPIGTVMSRLARARMAIAKIAGIN
ncbi:MAG TPA: RNA polymerase sigma factor [Rhizobiaceae bacterium]|nr:RNA polymerase sigma factor [Rhizobiaceae bacterium]